MSSNNPVRYSVTATLKDFSILDEYVSWLKGGHVQGVISGGAMTAEINILESDDDVVRVESVYTFSSRASLQAYFDGPAVSLREEGKKLFIDTGKISFSRRIGEIIFSL